MKRPFSFLNSYKQHNYFLLGGVAICLFVIYLTSISKTLDHRQKYKRNLANVQRAATATKDIKQYRAQMEGLQQTALKVYDREQLLSEITGFCKEHSILVRTFPEPQKIIENGHSIVTNNLVVEGRYKDIVALVYQIEQEEKLAAISSVKFYMYNDRVSRSQKLRCDLILRNLE